MGVTYTDKLFFTERKLKARLEDIKNLRYRDIVNIPILLVNERNTDAKYPLNGPWQEKRLGECWKGRDQYLWVTFDVTIPASFVSKSILCFVDFGITGGGGNSGFEALAFLNGKPYQGVDSNHKEIFLPNDVVGKKLDLTLKLWSGLEGGGKSREMEHRFSQAFVCWLDERVDELYYLARAIIETNEQLPETNENSQKLLKLLNDTFKLIDWSSDDIYSSLYKAHAYLVEGVEKLEKFTDIVINCIGHTHIDVAWLWRLKHTREKAARSFTTVLRLMERYPHYIFLQSQPRLYDYIKEDYPEIYTEIKKRIQEGRWDANGAMWVEADCNLISGESLVRQILLGKKFFKEEFGKDADFLWLPDVFGYSWALPQILKKSGVNTFLTSKISWNQYNKIPHDTFLWKGIDGTEILTHMITTPQVNAPKESWFYTYNGRIHANTIAETWNRYIDKDINNELLLAYGHGDGGGGVEREMLELIKHLDKMPGIPHVKTQTATEFFHKLHERLHKTDRFIPEWDGELYLEYHRGTYTSQALIKKYNRKLENYYRLVEMLSVYAEITKGVPYNRDTLEKGWKIILTNQFHDIIPGSSIKEVYIDAVEDYKKAEHLASEVLSKFEDRLDKSSDTYLIFNNSNWNRNDYVLIPHKHSSFKSNDSVLTTQDAAEGTLVYLENLKPLAFTVIQTSNENNTLVEPFTFDGRILETPFYTIEFDDKGHIKHLYDKEAEREVLAPNQCGNVIQTFEDRPMSYDAWDIDIYYQEKPAIVDNLVKFTVKEKGPLRFVLEIEWQHLHSKIYQDIIFYAHTRRIDFKTKVDWRERRRLMKVAFPVDIRTTKATYDIQFGNIERPNHWNTSWDLAKFEVVGHKWADLSDGGYGISLLNDCKYGYDIKGNVMRLTLLKSPTYPDPEADLGVHEFTYALYPHLDDWRKAQTEIEAFKLNNPLNVFEGCFDELSQSLIIIDKNNVEISAIKKAEYDDAYIIRLYEFEGKKTKCTLTSDYTIITITETDLMENEIGPTENTQVLTITLNPYEIRTFKIRFKK